MRVEAHPNRDNEALLKNVYISSLLNFEKKKFESAAFV